MKTQKHILNPDKISQVLGAQWKHPRIPDENDEYRKIRYDTAGFIYNLPNRLTLSFNFYFNPHSIQLSSGKKKELFTVFFENITGIKYLFHYKILILESKQKNSFSQLWISANGVFRLEVGIPIADYEKRAWIENMGDGREEETRRLATSGAGSLK